jgi:hypothetical protein
LTLVLKCDCSGADAYLDKTITFPGSPSDIYVQFDVYVPSATLTALQLASDGYSATFLDFQPDDGVFLGDGTPGSLSSPATFGTNFEPSSTGIPNAFSADTWHTIKLHIDTSGNWIWVLDGVTEFTNALGVTPTGSTTFHFGGWSAFHAMGEIYYLDNILVGSTLGGSDYFADNFESGSLAGWDAVFGAASISSGPAPPGPPQNASSGVYVAFGEATLSEAPAYQPILNVQSWSTDRGRQYELDKTQAGTAVINVIDQTGLYDPTNPDGPYFGLIGPLAPAQILAVNPVSSVTEVIFTGFVESWDYVLDQTERWMILTINLTDAFELLARAETVPDSSGTTILAADLVEDRIRGVLADYGWPSDKELIFSGNVHLQETVYNPQTSLLSVLQDCADAELPNAANIFMDKWGQVAFRGRFSRLIPQIYGPRDGGLTPPSGHKAINFWEVGDIQAAETFGIAPIAEIEWILDLKNVINACLCTPNGIAQADIAGQLVFNAGSIAQYGTRSLTISDLLTLDQVSDPSQDQPFLDAKDACKVFGQYYVDNYAQPVEMISHIAFKTRDPSDSLALPLWDFILGVEIGDVVKVWTTNPGGGGFVQTQFFVEGIHNTVAVLQAGLFDFTTTLDLSPRAWYQTFDGTIYYRPGGGGGPTPSLSADFAYAQ